MFPTGTDDDLLNIKIVAVLASLVFGVLMVGLIIGNTRVQFAGVTGLGICSAFQFFNLWRIVRRRYRR